MISVNIHCFAEFDRTVCVCVCAFGLCAYVIMHSMGPLRTNLHAAVYIVRSKHVRLDEFSLCWCLFALSYSLPLEISKKTERRINTNKATKKKARLLIGCCLNVTSWKSIICVHVRARAWQQRYENENLSPPSHPTRMLFVFFVDAIIILFLENFMTAANLITHDVYLIERNVC